MPSRPTFFSYNFFYIISLRSEFSDWIIVADRRNYNALVFTNYFFANTFLIYLFAVELTSPLGGSTHNIKGNIVILIGFAGGPLNCSWHFTPIINFNKKRATQLTKQITSLDLIVLKDLFFAEEIIIGSCCIYQDSAHSLVNSPAGLEFLIVAFFFIVTNLLKKCTREDFLKSKPFWF